MSSESHGTAAELAVGGVCGVEGRKEGTVLVSSLITCLMGSSKDLF